VLDSSRDAVVEAIKILQESADLPPLAPLLDLVLVAGDYEQIQAAIATAISTHLSG
jgi:hypothetical protein